jgi:O-antigen/teichoic acid export membrane protein
MIPVTLVYQSVVISVFPMLCRRIAVGSEDVVHVLSRMLDLLLALAIPTAVAIFFLSDSALVLLYGEREFLQASPALRVMVWTLVPVALTSVLGQIFLAGSRETVTLRIVAANLLVAAVAGVVLISSFGLIGAAIAAVVTKAVSLWQHYRPVSRLVPRLSLLEVGWKPAVAGACMAIYLAAAGGAHASVTAASAAALYVAVLLALTMWTTGGPRRFRAAWSDVWLSRRQI